MRPVGGAVLNHVDAARGRAVLRGGAGCRGEALNWSREAVRGRRRWDVRRSGRGCGPGAPCTGLPRARPGSTWSRSRRSCWTASFQLTSGDGGRCICEGRCWTGRASRWNRWRPGRPRTVTGLVFVDYSYELVTGGPHRNVEAITERDGLVLEVQVFFGDAQ